MMPTRSDISPSTVAQIEETVQEGSGAIVQFLHEIVGIPSINSQIRDVGERIRVEMDALGFDETWFDTMGNVVGRIGTGPHSLLRQRGGAVLSHSASRLRRARGHQAGLRDHRRANEDAGAAKRLSAPLTW